jgi:hypothetical protein
MGSSGWKLAEIERALLGESLQLVEEDELGLSLFLKMMTRSDYVAQLQVALNVETGFSGEVVRRYSTGAFGFPGVFIPLSE